MELLSGKIENLSINDANSIVNFLSKTLGFTDVYFRPINGDWFITAGGREEVLHNTPNTEPTPSDPADMD